MEKYNLEHWRAVPDRSRGTWARPAAKFKREFAGYINRARDLTATDKLVGRLLVDYYNEKYGCAWPSTKTIAEDTGASVRAVNKATNTLHETGLIHKVIGGGWDRTKIRHVPNRYYPAFSLITNGDGGLVKNGSELSGNPPETRSNAGAPPAGSASPQDLRVSKSENRQFSKGTPRNSCTPYSDNGMANANASPVPADASTVSHAPPVESEVDGISLEWEEEEEEEEESPEQEYSTIALACNVAVKTPAGQIWALLNYDTLRFREPLSDNTRFGLDEFAFEARCAADQDPSKVETLAGDEYDVLITRPPGWLSTVQGMPCGDWKAEVINHENFRNLVNDCRVKVTFWS